MSEDSRSNTLRLVPVLVFLGIAAAFGYALYTGDPSKLPSTLIGKPAPQSTFAPVEGLAAGGKPVPGFTSAELANGKVKVVNFWASWCGPCVDEHPLLTNLKAETGIEIWGVNYKDTPANARMFLQRHGNPFAVVGSDAQGRAAIDWGVYGIPETYVINGAGAIVYKHVGPLTQELIAAKLAPTIAAAAKTALPAPSPTATPTSKP